MSKLSIFYIFIRITYKIYIVLLILHSTSSIPTSIHTLYDCNTILALQSYYML